MLQQPDSDPNLGVCHIPDESRRFRFTALRMYGTDDVLVEERRQSVLCVQSLSHPSGRSRPHRSLSGQLARARALPRLETRC